jgi:flagellar biosynthetic protein FlhB
VAEDSDLEKTEEASPRKLEKAREDGDVPRSRELATFTVLMAATMGFWISGETILNQLKNMLTQGLSFERMHVMDPTQLGIGLFQQITNLMLSFIPLIGIIMLTALASPLLIGGWLFSGKALGPNFGKLNPLKGFANMFSTHALVELLKAISKTLLVGLVAWVVFDSNIDEIFALIHEPPVTASAHYGKFLLESFTAMVGALAIIALFDAPYQVYHYTQKLMMTRQDLRDEAKESDGNPEIKSRIRAQQREMARRRMMSEVPTADVVITNPTHFAVALKYADNSTTAPLVIAKGKNELATRIRTLANEHNVLIMEAPPLARALYHHTDLGNEIPASLYTTVAQVLAYVFQLRTWRKTGGIAPIIPKDLSVPKEMDPLTEEAY